MSKCCCKKQTLPTPPVYVPQPNNNCICSLPTLVILILIVLQFSKTKGYCDEDSDGGWSGGHGLVGNGILFIIALFFLSCSGCGRGGYGAY